ncbi:NAD(P)(+) transhydrogenase (Re/Si-specific) subunit alpha, partial [bacterium AH-315-E10]|nr:NAD(P)(+) transhydrogenase (Re/Si-specific) subunit alpha [bacterium AH-315-E10]
VKNMKPGSVIVDLAVETGGNVAGSELGKITDVNGVKIIGYGNLPGRVPVHASQMYSNNLVNMLTEFWDEETKTFPLDFEDELLNACVITHDGEIRDERFQ